MSIVTPSPLLNFKKAGAGGTPYSLENFEVVSFVSYGSNGNDGRWILNDEGTQAFVSRNVSDNRIYYTPLSVPFDISSYGAYTAIGFPALYSKSYDVDIERRYIIASSKDEAIYNKTLATPNDFSSYGGHTTIGDWTNIDDKPDTLQFNTAVGSNRKVHFGGVSVNYEINTPNYPTVPGSAALSFADSSFQGLGDSSYRLTAYDMHGDGSKMTGVGPAPDNTNDNLRYSSHVAVFPLSTPYSMAGAGVAEKSFFLPVQPFIDAGAVPAPTFSYLMINEIKFLAGGQYVSVDYQVRRSSVSQTTYYSAILRCL